jgi:hypothetical protein
VAEFNNGDLEVMKMDDMRRVLSSSVQKLLRPLVRILLRNGMPFGTFMELAKGVFVEVAATEFGIANKKQTDSRLSMITGLSHKEVKNVKQITELNEVSAVERYNRAARVISGWVRDRTFQDDRGEPALLPVEAEGACFSELIKKYSGDVPARAILDELLRVKAVERLKDGHFRLLERAYIPRTGESDKLSILGTDVALLIATIDHNLVCEPKEAFFQRKVAYNNLPAEAIPELRKITKKQAQALLESLDCWLAEQDRDTNPRVTGTGRKHAGVGIYFFEEEVEEFKENEN